ncbi:TorF family putative porin [Sphingosinicella terrae]|uniref:TorF family putative porin n=1 Tax=Sphingosinicella terrae TaxID=2172047 RepID=UPI0013B408CB|nr:TorF family putative porin [Sphingosinicella terrae]
MVRFAVAAAMSLAAGSAHAQDDPEIAAEFQEPPLGAGSAGIDVSAGIELMSDYRFRGVSRSDEDPAVQATVNLFHDSGLYAGARATTLKGRDSFRLRDPGLGDLGDVQLDLYAGYNARLGGGFEADAGLLYYAFVDGEGATDYVEPYASLSYLIGPVMATAGAKYAPSQQAIGDEDSLYLFGQVDVSIPFRPWSFSATLGHQDWGRFGDYWTWSIGVEHQLQVAGLPGTRIGLSYVDTDLRSRPGQDAGIVATLGLSF